MQHKLLSTFELIGLSWKSYTSNFRLVIDIAARLLVALLLMSLSSFLPEAILGSKAITLVLVIIGYVAGLVLNIHTFNAATHALLLITQHQQSTELNYEIGNKFLLSQFLLGLAVALLSLGGFILFVIPGIWASVAFSFAYIALIDENAKVEDAIKRSKELVKGRWWSVFGKQLAFGIITGLIFVVLFGILLIGAVVLLDGIGTEAMKTLTIPLALILLGIVAVFIPFQSFFQIYQYKNLKETR